MARLECIVIEHIGVHPTAVLHPERIADPAERVRVLALSVGHAEGARRDHRRSGICGQAPSDHSEVARYLIRLGIASISLTPDRVLGTMQAVAEIERQRG